MQDSSIFTNLANKSSKGENGTILIIGGSYKYTGAPIFSAKAAMRSGSDLVYIWTTKKAILPIKSMHNAIVSKITYKKSVLNKITACVIGPGLGRVKENILNDIIYIANYLSDRNIPIIIDADGIHYYKRGLFHNLKTCILTPNHNENKRLNVSPGHIKICKGINDKIYINSECHLVFTPGSGKRCGGQGDILTGVLATALSICKGNLLEACLSACKLTRISANIAFYSKGYSTIAEDIIESLPLALYKTLNKHKNAI